MTSRRRALRATVELFAIICATCTSTSCIISAVKRSRTRAQESALRDTLFYMRKAIKDYSDQKNELPHSLDDLVNAGFLQKIPVDPVTEDTKWQIVIGDQINGKKVAPGVVDVHSLSTAKSSKNDLYSDW